MQKNKKLIKILKIILLVLLSIIIFFGVFLLGCYIKHSVKLNKEKEYFVSNGTQVEVNGHNLNVYVGGNPESKLTLVFMSGAGTCSPTLDFKSLYSLYESDYKVAVIEKAGYGFSDDSDVKRDIDTVLFETREALHMVGITENLVLFPHSMSGIEALYWANEYPDEVNGIVGLDPATPQSYENMQINHSLFSLARFGINVGLARVIPSIVNSSAAIKFGNLTEQEKELYRIIFYRRTATIAMLNEAKEIKQSAKKLADIDQANAPMLFFVSNGDGTGYSKTEWQSFALNYTAGKQNGKCVLLDCSHYVHDIKYAEIYSQSLMFIAALDVHHGLPLMKQIAALREKYDLHMRVERYITDDSAPKKDKFFIRQ